MELILFLSLLVNGHFLLETRCIEKKSTISEIGICDLIGECSVELEDGKRLTKNKPWIGDEVTYLSCK